MTVRLERAHPELVGQGHGGAGVAAATRLLPGRTRLSRPGGRASHSISKQDGHLLAFVFEGGAGGENPLGKVRQRVGEWRFCRVSDRRGG